jgi:hypothetical protein
MKFVLSIIISVFVLCSYSTFSQNENKQWIVHFSDNDLHLTRYIFEENGINKSIINDKRLLSINSPVTTISDKRTGDLLFYTIRNVIYKDKHIPVDTITYMNTANSAFGKLVRQSLIIPFSSENTYTETNKYYLFYLSNAIKNRLTYSIIDMNDGMIKVTMENITLRDSVLQGLTGTIDCSSGNYWLIAGDENNRRFYSYKITEKGIDSSPVISDFNEILPPSTIGPKYYGSYKLSPDGTKLIALTGNNTGGAIVLHYEKLHLYDFDKRTGIISNGRLILDYSGEDWRAVAEDFSFSSNSKVLYIASYVSHEILYQYEILNDNIFLRDSFYLGSFRSRSHLQLGMDKKIYYGKYIIHNPNTLGSGCNLRVFDSSITTARYPNMMEHTMSDSYGLAGMKSNYCMEFPGTIDTVYGCVGKPIKVYHKDAGRVLFRKWTINNADIIEQGLDSIVFSVKQKGIYPIQLNSVKQSRSDVLRTVAIVDDIPKADAGKDIYACDSVQIGSAGEKNIQYSWTPTEGLNNPNIPNPIAAAPKKEIKYTVRAFTKGGCENYDEIIVRPGIPVQPTINRDTIICFGNSVPLQAGGGTKYEWFPKSGLNNYFIANPIAIPSTTTRYKVIISNATCTDSAFVTITIKENEKADAGRDKELCAGLSVRLGTNNNPQVEYSWSPADYLDNPKSANPLCTPEKNMQYILTVKNSNGCENYDTVNVTLGGELSVFAGADTNVCEGEQIQLNASGAENFSWSPAEGLSNATIANPIFTGTSTTQYIVTGKSGNCEGKDTILVTVNEKPIIIASENREICVGDTVHLSAKGATEYSWSPAEGLNNATIPNPIFNGTKTTEYIVTGKNGNCFDSKKVLITVNEKPTLLVSENRELCSGDTVHLSAKGALEYSWSPVDGLHNPTIANPIFTGTKTTEYIVTGKTGNCFDSKRILITVNEKPTLSVSENREICLGDTVHLRANNADSYLWTPSTYLNNSTISNPIAQPTENITYTVRGTNTNGCYEEKTISITINNDQEKTISLQLSDTAQYAPGTIVPVKIIIPEGLAQTTLTLEL